MSNKAFIEEIEISVDALLGKIKSLVHEGNIRRIIIKNENNEPVIEIPLTLGIVGAAILPAFAAIGALAALAAKWKIAVVKEGEPVETATETTVDIS